GERTVLRDLGHAHAPRERRHAGAIRMHGDFMRLAAAILPWHAAIIGRREYPVIGHGASDAVALASAVDTRSVRDRGDCSGHRPHTPMMHASPQDGRESASPTTARTDRL